MKRLPLVKVYEPDADPWAPLKASCKTWCTHRDKLTTCKCVPKVMPGHDFVDTYFQQPQWMFEARRAKLVQTWYFLARSQAIDALGVKGPPPSHEFAPTWLIVAARAEGPGMGRSAFESWHPNTLAQLFKHMAAHPELGERFHTVHSSAGLEKARAYLVDLALQLGAATG